MAFSQADLDSIKKAIASGLLEARVDDKLVKYQTTSEMQLALRIIQSELQSAANPGRTVPRYQLANFSDDGIA